MTATQCAQNFATIAEVLFTRAARVLHASPRLLLSLTSGSHYEFQFARDPPFLPRSCPRSSQVKIQQRDGRIDFPTTKVNFIQIRYAGRLKVSCRGDRSGLRNSWNRDTVHNFGFSSVSYQAWLLASRASILGTRKRHLGYKKLIDREWQSRRWYSYFLWCLVVFVRAIGVRILGDDKALCPYCNAVAEGIIWWNLMPYEKLILFW